MLTNSFRLRIHAEAVRDAVDVVEVGHHLAGVVDLPVVPSGDPQGLGVGMRDAARRESEFLRPRAQSKLARIERSIPPTMSDQVIGERSLSDLGTEVMRMSLGSVFAGVRQADHDCERLADAPG